MKYSHTSIYWLKGLSPSRVEEEITIDLPLSVQAVLTSNPNDYCFEGDRMAAFANLLLDGVFGRANSDTFDECLEKALAEIKESREKEFEPGLYLVFIREGNISNFMPSHEEELEEFVVCFDGASKEEIQEVSESHICALLSALVLSIDNVLGVKKFHDSVVFLRIDKKPVYSYTASVGSAPLSVSKPVNRDSVKPFVDWYQVMLANKELERVNRLLLLSLQVGDDKLRAFLAAWAALEVLVTKTFKSYEEKLFEELDNGAYPNVPHQYLRQTRSVMKAKWALADKFSLISSLLCPEAADKDIEEFKEVQKERNKLIHEKGTVEANLPVELVQKLVRKYLQLHLAPNTPA